MASLKYWLWLTGLHHVQPEQVTAALQYFGTPEGVYFADPGEYEMVEQLTPAARAAMKDKSLTGAEKIMQQCDRLGIGILTLLDAQYPDCLKHIKNPPPVLYYKGRLPAFDELPVIGVVGARACTPYGEKVAARLGLELARAGAVLVSGIAQGIDSCAVKGALAGGGTIVSVLGCGVDVHYPASSRYLYDDVAACGLLLSEYPPGTPARGTHFPVRNRIISGLADGVAAVECEVSSGTMITMNLALEQGRDTFAVPGPVDARMSEGTNLLIRDGYAKLITGARDILIEYAGRYPMLRQKRIPLEKEAEESRLEAVSASEQRQRADISAKKEVDKSPTLEYIDWKNSRELFTEDERDILLALGEGEKSADELIELTQIPAKRALSALTVLEVRGYVESRRSGWFTALVLLRK